MRAGIDYVVNFLIFEKSKAGSAANEIVGMIGSRMDDANTRYILRDRWRRKVVKCNIQPQKLVLFVKNIMQKAENLNRFRITFIYYWKKSFRKFFCWWIFYYESNRLGFARFGKNKFCLGHKIYWRTWK